MLYQLYFSILLVMHLMYPLFLLSLTVVAVPIIIHLLQLRRPQRLRFTNTAFIKEVELVMVRHRQIQHLLILLARIVALSALVLVFCQPFLSGEERKTSLGQVAVFVDNTYSMQVSGTQQNALFEEAVNGAVRLGRNTPNASKLTLLNNGSGALPVASFQNKLDKLRLSGRNALSKLGGIGGTAGAANAALYVFSDFQKSAFKPDVFTKFGVERDVVLVPLKGRETGNAYVDSVWLDDAFVRVNTNLTLHIRLRNGGLATAAKTPVKVFFGTQQAAAFQVTVGAGQTVTSVVQVQLAEQTLALGRVVTEDVPVTFDNTYYFTLQPAAAIRVLEIGATPAAKELYLNESLFQYSFAQTQRVDYGALQRANLVLLHEVVDIDAGLRDALRAVAKRGGSVVVVPSAATASHESYQRLFRELGLGTVQWEAAVPTPEMREVTMPNAQEPFFRNVFGAQQRAVTMPRVAPVLRWTRTGADLLRTRDGESYLANFSSGNGRVYVFSAPFAKEYSDFVTHALFVPVMYRMAMLSYRNEQLPAYRLTQTSVTLQRPSAPDAGASARSDEASYRLVKDSLTLIPAQRVVGQDVHLALPAGMDAPGFYQVQRRGQTLTTLAFNQDKHESELAAYSAAELRQLIGPNRPNIRVLETGVSNENLAKIGVEEKGQPLWRYFLALALAGLLAEALLVRFGSRRTTVAKVAVAA